MKRTYIELLGERHPLCFSLSAVEEITDAFGGMEGMTEALKNGTQAEKLKAAVKVLDILIRAGRRYCAAAGEELPPPIRGEISDIIDATDPASISAIFAAINADGKREIEAKSKNADPTQDR